MPKISKVSWKIRTWIAPYNKNTEIFSTDGEVVFCIVCEKMVGAKKKFFIDAHAKTEMHKAALNANLKNKPTLITNITPEPQDKKNQFTNDLCKALVSANIPLFKLNNPCLKKFLQQYTNEVIPDESTLRKNYLPTVYEQQMEEIRSKIDGKYVYIIVNETIDCRGNYIANLLIGVLDVDQARKPFLVACKQLTNTNHVTVSQFVNENLMLHFSPKIKSRVLLLVTDEAPYMAKAASTLKIFYTNMLHVTCMVHGLHRIAEILRESCNQTNKLVSNGKMAFLKAPSRVCTYKNILPNTPLPPEAVVTRWGSWVEAALLEKFQEVVRNLVDDAACVKTLKETVADENLKCELTFINAHMSFLPKTINSLKKFGMPLYESIKILQESISNVKSITGQRGELLNKKMDAVLNNNSGYAVMEKYAKILTGEVVHGFEFNCDIVSHFKYAPITSCFFTYKQILQNRTINFTEENLEKYIVVQFNSIN